MATEETTSVLDDIFGDGKSTDIDPFIPEDDVSTFPFSGTSDAYMNPAKFVRNLYEGDGDKKPWITHTPGRLATVYKWMVMLMGKPNLKPDLPKEPVEDAKNPHWRWAECWRVLNTYKALLKKAETTKYPVKEWLQSSPKNETVLFNAMFPEDVKRLLIANENQIVTKGLPWVAAPPRKYESLSDIIEPYPGVLVTNGAPEEGFKFSQVGAMGQMSIEASFILATQLAGINWEVLRKKITKDRYKAGVYWIGGILPDDKGDQPIAERRKDLPERKELGYLSRRKLLADGSPDAGFCVVLDIDPDFDGPVGKNLFLFACHGMDQHSRVYVEKPASTLHNMKYLKPYPLKGTVKPKQMDEKQKKGVRFYGHGHSAVMTYQAWKDWITQKPRPNRSGEPMPDYKQVGEGHLYFLTEDEHEVWPRGAWIKTNPSLADDDDGEA